MTHDELVAWAKENLRLELIEDGGGWPSGVVDPDHLELQVRQADGSWVTISSVPVRSP